MINYQLLMNIPYGRTNCSPPHLLSPRTPWHWVCLEKYEAILDAEWTDEHCTLEHYLKLYALQFRHHFQSYVFL